MDTLELPRFGVTLKRVRSSSAPKWVGRAHGLRILATDDRGFWSVCVEGVFMRMAGGGRSLDIAEEDCAREVARCLPHTYADIDAVTALMRSRRRAA